MGVKALGRHQLDFSMFNELCSVVFSNRASPLVRGEQHTALAITWVVGGIPVSFYVSSEYLYSVPHARDRVLPIIVQAVCELLFLLLQFFSLLRAGAIGMLPCLALNEL